MRNVFQVDRILLWLHHYSDQRESMHSDHLVILGVKANSWAWGIEQSAALAKSGINVTTLDFDLHGNSQSPRTRVQKRELDFGLIQQLHASDFVSRKSLKDMDSNARQWVNDNAENANWINSEVDGLPLGRIVMSNYARIVGTRDFDLQLMPKNLQRKIISLALLADYLFTIVERDYIEISLSNGRSPIEAVFLVRARQYGKKINVIERGASTKQWFVYKTSPHFAPDWWEMMNQVESQASTKELERISAEYWHSRLKGWDELSSRDWSKEFEIGKVPSSLTLKSVMFFCTSQHEVPVVSEFECTDKGYPNQQNAVRELVKLCKELDKRLVVKRHPNSVSTDGVDREASDWEWVKSEKNVIYIDPLSRVDTYEILKMAESVVTFKSSVGIEASALGIPARCMGPAEWAFKEETRVWNHETLAQFISNPTPLDSSIHQTWGYLAKTFGKKLNCFSDITGGYAKTIAGEVIFSADYYDNSFFTLALRVINKLWSLKIKFLSK